MQMDRYLFLYIHTFMMWLVTGDTILRKDNRYCWAPNFTYETCCGDNSDCFDSDWPRQSCCDISNMKCWDDDLYSWKECCNLALPYGRSSCFHGDLARGIYCCTEKKWGSLAGKKKNDDDADVYAQVKKHDTIISFADTGHHLFWFYYEAYEEGTFRVFDHFLTPDIEQRRAKMVWDIGGFIGQTCVYLAHLADRVLVMEPSPSAFKALVQNIRANGDIHDKIIPVNKALGGVNKNATVSNAGDSFDHIIPQSQLKSVRDKRMTAMQVVTPEAMLENYPALAETEFIKVDVEGYEVELVPALEPFIRRYRPRLFLSLHPGSLTLEQMDDVCTRLSRIFPFLYEITESSTLVPFDIGRLRRDKFINARPGSGLDFLGMWSEIPVEKREMGGKGTPPGRSGKGEEL